MVSGFLDVKDKAICNMNVKIGEHSRSKRLRRLSRLSLRQVKKKLKRREDHYPNSWHWGVLGPQESTTHHRESNRGEQEWTHLSITMCNSRQCIWCNHWWGKIYWRFFYLFNWQTQTTYCPQSMTILTITAQEMKRDLCDPTSFNYIHHWLLYRWWSILAHAILN